LAVVVTQKNKAQLHKKGSKGHWKWKKRK